MEAVRTKVIGIGGAGVNSVNHLLAQPYPHLSYLVIDTDIKTLQSIQMTEKLEKLTIGHTVTRGLSSGGDASVALKALELDKEKIEASLQNVDLLFIIAGLGGGVGSVIASYIARLAMKQGTLVISLVMMPFTLEGSKKHQLAEKTLGDLRIAGHVTIPLPNDLLLQSLPRSATVNEAFELASFWIRCAVNAISGMIYEVGIINLDFSSLKHIFSNGGGKTLFGLGAAQGADYCKRALNEVACCPILYTPHAHQSADSLLINIKGGKNLSLQNIHDIGAFLSSHFNSKENTAIGAIIDETREDYLEIVVIGISDINKGSPRSVSSVRSDGKSYPQQQFLFDDLPPETKNEKRRSPKKPIGGNDPTDLDNMAIGRGYFGQLEPILINGEDIDIPTYLRRGIKIELY